MSDKFAAAQRLAGLMPKDIRALDDEDTAKLIADLRATGLSEGLAAKLEEPFLARSVISNAKAWGHILRTVNRILRGEDRAPDPGPCPPIRKPPATKSQRLASVADRGQCGITAAEANQFLAGLPPVPFYGE